jgi:hypothetical protein
MHLPCTIVKATQKKTQMNVTRALSLPTVHTGGLTRHNTKEDTNERHKKKSTLATYLAYMRFNAQSICDLSIGTPVKEQHKRKKKQKTQVTVTRALVTTFLAYMRYNAPSICDLSTSATQKKTQMHVTVTTYLAYRRFNAPSICDLSTSAPVRAVG